MDPLDAITGDELSGQVPSASSAAPSANAFTELMRPKKPAPKRAPHPQLAGRATNNMFLGRDGLGPYIERPQDFYPDRVIWYDDDLVAVRDLYPKATIHTLLLPRDRKKTKMHPKDALEDEAFRKIVLKGVERLRLDVASELRRQLGHFSRAEVPRLNAMLSDDVPDELPTGRDWDKDIVTGFHAHPSMSHLHIHVLSVDRVSECLRDRKHYNSFATPFLVPVEDMPLSSDDPRREPGRTGYLDWDLKCWRCGKNFGNKFSKLKAHLDEEFEEWKME